jgi:hypothetical protein
MSSPMAIAAVTAVIKDLLNNGIIANDLATTIGTVRVTSRAPDRVFSGGTSSEPSQLNLFLYHVAPNAAWRNVDFPSRDSLGERLKNPPLALDLHYLLTAYGAEDFHSEILLGYAMQLMHETPILTRAAIRAALTPTSPISPSILPPSYAGIAASDLADQVELIKITPHVMSTEEMSKLWAAFQSHYRPTAAYSVSVVLIENARSAKKPLPVLSRGPVDPMTNRDRGVIVQPNLLPPFPTLEEAVPPNAQTVVIMGDNLTLTGHHLTGATINGAFRHLKSGTLLTLNSTGTPTDTEVVIQIPPDPPLVPPPTASPLNPDNWQIGQYSAAAVVDTGGPAPRVSNEVGVVLAPRITAPIGVAIASGVVTLTVTVSPRVWRGQRARLIVRDVELIADPLTTDLSSTLTFRADQAELPTGNQRVRLVIDGAESILIDRTGPVPVFDPAAQVTI